jgi:hypothetical protein
MQSTGKLLKTIDYSNKIKKTIGYSSNIASNEADLIIKEYSYLISDPKYKPYFYKKLYTLGKSAFMTIAGRAKEGKNPPALFVYLLNEYDQKR